MTRDLKKGLFVWHLSSQAKTHLCPLQTAV